MAVQPYKVANKEQPVDFVLAILRGGLAGYAGGKKAKEEADAMEREFQLKVRQVDMVQAQMDQQYKMHVEDLEQQKENLLSQQTHDKTMLEMKNAFDKEIARTNMKAQTMMFLANWQKDMMFQRQNIKMQLLNIGANMSAQEKQAGMEQQRIDIASKEAESNAAYRKESLAIDREKLAITRADMAADAENRKLDRQLKLSQIQDLGDMRAIRAYQSVTNAYDKLSDNLTKIGMTMDGETATRLGDEGLKWVTLAQKALAEKEKYKKSSDAAKANLSNLTKKAAIEMAKQGLDFDVYISKEELYNENGELKKVKEATMPFSQYLDSLPDDERKKWEGKPPSISVNRSDLLTNIQDYEFNPIKEQIRSARQLEESTFRIYPQLQMQESLQPQLRQPEAIEQPVTETQQVPLIPTTTGKSSKRYYDRNILIKYPNREQVDRIWDGYTIDKYGNKLYSKDNITVSSRNEFIDELKRLAAHNKMMARNLVGAKKQKLMILGFTKEELDGMIKDLR